MIVHCYCELQQRADHVAHSMDAVLFMVTAWIACKLRPEWGGRKVETSWADRIRVLPDLLPPLLIFAFVVGAIYAGWATPSESAALGVLVAAGLAAWNRRLTVTAPKGETQ